MCPRIKPSNHSAKLSFTQQAWFESLSFVGLTPRKVGISSTTVSSCVSIVVSKHCMDLIFPVAGGQHAAYSSGQKVWEELSSHWVVTWSLRHSGCPVHVGIFILCMNHQKALFSSISSLRSPSRILLIATLELGT